MERILITGANGLIGKKLSKALVDKGYEVVHLSRSENLAGSIPCYAWDYTKNQIDLRALQGVDHIVHLAGAGIADQRWTAARKKELLESRVLTLALLYKNIQKLNLPLKTLISASGINHYGSTTSEHIFEENDPKGNEFISEITTAWEHAAFKFESICRVVCLRTGIVIAKNGGALPKMDATIKLNLGSVLGSGKQWMPWISLDDICNIYLAAIQNQRYKGVYNAVAPEHINNEDFTITIAKALNKKLWLPNVPGVVLRIVFGELATLLLNGSRASCNKLLAAGFKFKYPSLSEALKNIYKNEPM